MMKRLTAAALGTAVVSAGLARPVSLRAAANVDAVRRKLRNAKAGMALRLDSYADAFDIDLDALVSPADDETRSAARLAESAC